MSSVVVDSVLVEAGWDPSALERGLARSERLVLDFGKLHPAITLGVNGKELDALSARITAIGKTPIVLPPIEVPPIVVPPVTPPPAAIVPPIVVPPTDFTQTIAEATRAAAIVREEFESALRGASRVMSIDAFDAGIVAGKELQAGLVGEIRGIGQQVAAGLISIPAATAQIDAAIEAMSIEAKRLQATIPPIQIRTLVMPEGARGVTTGASPSVIPTAELDEAEESFDNLTGAAQATNQQFVKIGSSSSQMRVGLRTVGSTLASVGAQAVGAQTQVGRLAEQLLFMAGSGVALAAAAAFAVVAVAYEKLTAGARLAREEQDKLASSLSASVNTGPQDTGLAVQQLQTGQIRNLTAIETLERGIAAARGRQRDLQQEITTGLPAEVAGWANVLSAAGRVLGIQAALLDPVTRILEKLRLERDVRLGIIALAAEEARESNAIAAGRQAQAASAVAFASSLASGLQSQIKIADSARLTAAHAADLRKLIAGGTQDYALQVAAVAALNALEKGRIAGLEQQSAAQQQAANQQAQLLQEFTSQQDALGAPITIDIDVSDALANLNRLQGPLQKTADALRERAAPLLGAAVTADLGRQLLQEANQIEAFNRRIDQSNIAFENRRLARLQAGATAAVQAIQQAAQSQPTIPLPVQLDVDAALGQLEEARQAVLDRISAFTGAGKVVPPQETAKLTELEAQIQAAIELPAKVLLDSTGALGDRLSSLTAIAENARQLATQGIDRPETITEIVTREQSLLPILAILQTRYDAITAAIADQATPQSQINDLLREQGNILGQLAAHRIATPIEVTQLQPIQDAVQAYADARQKFEAATAQHLGPEARQAAADMDAAGKALDRAADSTIRTVLAMNLDAATTQRILDAIATGYQRIGRQAHQVSEETKLWLQRLSDVDRAIGGLQSIGNQLGIIDEKTNKVIDGFRQANQAAKEFASGDIVGGIVDSIGAVVSVAQGLFGKSADQKAAEAALHENTAAIRADTVRLSTGFTGIGGATSAADILRQVVASAAGQALIPNTQEGGATGREARLGLVSQLASLGLSFVDLQRLAEDFGITILEKGKLIGGSLEDLATQIDNSIAAQLRFTNSFTDQLQKQDLGSRLRGEPQDAASKFAREVQAAGTSGSTAITNAFKGIKNFADTPEVRKALVDLFNQFSAGTLDPATLGNLSRDEFLQFLNDGAGFLDTFNQGVQDAAKNLGDLNIPQGFKRAAIAFQVGDAGPDPAQLAARTAAVQAQFFQPPVPSLPTPPLIQPLPEDAQALLDKISKQAPPDLLAAVKEITAAIQGTRPATTDTVQAVVPAVIAQPDLQSFADRIAGLGSTPLASGAQALLDRIANKAPPDLLAAVQEITATIVAARQTATTGDVNASAPVAVFGAPRDTRTTITFEGGINVYISGEHKDPNKMTDDFFAALRRKALTQSGDTLQFGVR